jgi:hypothetical protein
MAGAQSLRRARITASIHRLKPVRGGLKKSAADWALPISCRSRPGLGNSFAAFPPRNVETPGPGLKAGEPPLFSQAQAGSHSANYRTDFPFAAARAGKLLTRSRPATAVMVGMHVNHADGFGPLRRRRD